MPLSSETRQVAGTVFAPPDSIRRGTDDFVERSSNSSQPGTIERLGTWRLENLLHAGKFTRSYRASHGVGMQARPGQYFVKVLSDAWRDEPVAKARLRNEATVGRCVAHRHIVPVLSAHVHRPPYYVVQPLLMGITAGHLLARTKKISLPAALWIARQAAEGLAALHLCGYLHGDVKPANFMLAANGHVTLVDFGCARRIHDESTLEVKTLSGTLPYLAPELFSGHWPDTRTEIYSLGIALFEILAGRLPHIAANAEYLAAMKREGATPDVRTYMPQVPREVAELVRALIARDPLRRPHPAAEVVDRLLRLEILTLGQRLPV